MQRADKEASEVKDLSVQLARAESTLRETEMRLEKQTLDSAKECSAMYARVVIEWFELSRRIGSPRQKAWSKYLQDNPEFNAKLQGACAKEFEGEWDVGVQKAYRTLSNQIHNCPPVLYGDGVDERILRLSDAIPSFVGCLVQFLATEVLSIKVHVVYGSYNASAGAEKD